MPITISYGNWDSPIEIAMHIFFCFELISSREGINKADYISLFQMKIIHWNEERHFCCPSRNIFLKMKIDFWPDPDKILAGMGWKISDANASCVRICRPHWNYICNDHCKSCHRQWKNIFLGMWISVWKQSRIKSANTVKAAGEPLRRWESRFKFYALGLLDRVVVEKSLFKIHEFAGDTYTKSNEWVHARF